MFLQMNFIFSILNKSHMMQCQWAPLKTLNPKESGAMYDFLNPQQPS